MTLCPSCHQPLPEPRERFCMHCGAALPAAEGDAGPIEPVSVPVRVPSPDPEPHGAPWDRRAEIGFFTALVDTTLQVLSKPRAFFGGMAVERGFGGPLVYAVLVGYVGLLATAVYDAVFDSLVGGQTPDLGLGPEFDRALALVQGGPGLLMQLVVGPFALALALFIGAGLNHLGLLLVGGARRGFEATFRVGAYTKAASVVSLLPVCGPFVAIVWSLVLTIIGLQTVHETTLGKAVAAALLPFAIGCCCCLGSLGLLAALAASAVP